MFFQVKRHHRLHHWFRAQGPFAGALGILLLGSAEPAAARITRLDITSVQSPTFGGTSFGHVGAYEKLVGKSFGEVDPDDPRNSAITDIRLAPHNSRGMVEYSIDVYIMASIDRSRGNHRVLFEVNNRGSKLAIGGPFGNSNDGVSGGKDRPQFRRCR